MQEKRIYLTIDIECHDIKRKNQYIDGVYTRGNCGLKYILELSKSLGVPVNCFLDFPEAREYGDEYIREIVNLIKIYNQNIFLHLHPDFISGDHERSYMWEYSREEKKKIIKQGFDIYKKFMGHDPKFFRVGRYGADEEMYDVMQELKIDVWDLSYCSHCSKMCHVLTENVKYNNVPFEWKGQKILPNTRYLGLETPKRDVFINFDTNHTTFDEFKRIIDNNKNDYLVLTMHSWNFMRKYFFLKDYVSLDEGEVRKFEKMVDYARKRGYSFCDLSKCPPKIIDADKIDEIINIYDNFFALFFMIVNNYVRFKKIGYLNKKYFIIYVMFYTMILLLLMFFLFH